MSAQDGTHKPTVLGMDHLGGVEDPIRVQDESGNPHLHYSAMHVRDAFVAGMAKAKSLANQSGEFAAILPADKTCRYCGGAGKFQIVSSVSDHAWATCFCSRPDLVANHEAEIERLRSFAPEPMEEGRHTGYLYYIGDTDIPARRWNGKIWQWLTLAEANQVRKW